MIQIKTFLLHLSKLVEPGENQRHNLTIDNEGDLVLSLMCDKQYLHFYLHDDDLTRIEENPEFEALKYATETNEHLLILARK